MSDENSENNYAIFISYSSKSDNALARKLHAFIGSFHRTATAKKAGLGEKPLKACLDGFDFKLPAGKRENGKGETGDPSARVPDVIVRHLAMCRELLVLCSSESMASKWVRDEIKNFVNNDRAARIRIALTHGNEAEKAPEQFFAPELVESGLHETIWYDLRGFYRQERKINAGVKDFDSERLRLIADLHDLAASEIEPLWLREQNRKTHIRYGIATAVVAVTFVLGSLLYAQWKLTKEQAERADSEKSMKLVSQTYRHRFTDPFAGAAAAYRANKVMPSQETDGALFEAHRVLIERYKIALQEQSIIKPESFSFVSQFTEGQRFTQLNPDGRHVLVVTKREGDRFSPKLRGDVYLLNNQTLHLVELDSCKRSVDYRLEFADFVGKDFVMVARAFHLDLYTLSGACIGSYQLQHTKTPVTAAGGMLYDVFFVAGNGAGCVWVEEYGNQGQVEPARELGVVKDCDEKGNPDAVTQILVGPAGRSAVNMFQSGRVDFFALDGMNGRPKRRPIVNVGGLTVAFNPKEKPASFAVASQDKSSKALNLARWDVINKEPQKVDEFVLKGVSGTIVYLGFSTDGGLLIGLDTACGLHYWDYRTRQHLFTHIADESICKPKKSTANG